MNSCIYRCRLYHERKEPKPNRFSYGIYLLYLDLDELALLDRKIPFFGYNRWNILSFYDKDHFTFLGQKGLSERISKEKVAYDAKKYVGKDTKGRIRTMIEELGLGFRLGKVFILTQPRNLGYLFNPVSFYYCFDEEGRFRVLFSEVNNTFHDQKMYYVVTDPKKKEWKDRQRKNYYISPFIDYDTDLEWRFTLPGTRLQMDIDSVKGDKAILRTTLDGKRREMTIRGLLAECLRHPMQTLTVIIMIHYQAFKLWRKGILFHKKDETDRNIARGL